MRRFALLVALACCNDPQDELADAKREVRRLFDAVAARDCATLGALIPKLAAPAACAAFLHEWNDDLHVVLVDLPAAEHDGRDHRAIIVRATVERHAARTTMLVRATHEQGAWLLAL